MYFWRRWLDAFFFPFAQLFGPHQGLPGVSSSRKQVDGFNKQLEVLLVPAFPSAASPSSAGLLSTASCLPCLDLSLFLLLQLYIYFLYLDGGAKKMFANLTSRYGSWLALLCLFTCFTTAALLSSLEDKAKTSFRDCRLEIITACKDVSQSNRRTHSREWMLFKGTTS